MKRRSYLSAVLAGLAGLKMAFAQKTKNPIVLYCDLSVAPAREQEMLHLPHDLQTRGGDIPGLPRSEDAETPIGNSGLGASVNQLPLSVDLRK